MTLKSRKVFQLARTERHDGQTYELESCQNVLHMPYNLQTNWKWFRNAPQFTNIHTMLYKCNTQFANKQNVISPSSLSLCKQGKGNSCVWDDSEFSVLDSNSKEWAKWNIYSNNPLLFFSCSFVLSNSEWIVLNFFYSYSFFFFTDRNAPIMHLFLRIVTLNINICAF